MRGFYFATAKLIYFLILSVILFCCKVEAQSSSDTNGLSWMQSGIGIVITKYTGTNTIVSVPNTINGMPVIAVGTNAFQYLPVVSVTLPDSVTEIRDYAFNYCSQLSGFSIPNKLVSIGVSSFRGSPSLGSVAFPSSLVSIGANAFNSCSLTNVTFSEGIQVVDAYAFYSNPLTNIFIPKSLTQLDPTSFDMTALLSFAVDPDNPSYLSRDGVLFDKGVSTIIRYPCAKTNGTYVVPGSVLHISDNAFSGALWLTNIDLPDGLVDIGQWAFTRTGIQRITIPFGVKNIKWGTFSECGHLKNCSLPITVTDIDRYAFYDTASLEQITLPTTLTRIGSHAFEHSGLKAISIPHNISVIEDCAFQYCMFLSGISFPGTTIPMGSMVFAYCPSLQSVPYGLVNMGSQMFYSCNGFTNLTIPPTVTNISYGAFQYCSGLKCVTIPSSVQSWAAWAFFGCNSLQYVCLEGDSPSFIGGPFDYVFGYFGYGPPSVFYYNPARSGWDRPRIGNIPGQACVGCANFMGFLTAELNPKAGASYDFGWSVDSNGIDLRDGDSTVVSPGQHIITFKDVPGWLTPAPQTVNVDAGQTQHVVGEYRALPVVAGRLTLLRASVDDCDQTIPEDPDVPISPEPVKLLSHPEKQSSLGLGVVADGVTPAIVRIDATPTNYSLAIELQGGEYTNGSIASHIFAILEGNAVRTTNIMVSSTNNGTNGVGFAYLQGLDWSNFRLSNEGDTQIIATLHLLQNGTEITNVNFFIRPPPVILVHGIADTGQTWSAEFIHALATRVPADFILPISYGGGSGSDTLQWPCTVSDFVTLAKEVDRVLRTNESILRNDWAFSRYDVIGHSQGGVLLRMLCQEAQGSGIFTSDGVGVFSQQNLYRGRFRRVISIGSPHNGTLLAYYCNKMRDARNSWDPFSLIPLAHYKLRALQKFNPDGDDIRLINNAKFPVDPRIPFCCLQTTIDNGRPPAVFNILDPCIYRIIDLGAPVIFGPNSGRSRGQVLIPFGSDGVVDLTSQGGGLGTRTYNLSGLNIAHAVGGILFDVAPSATQTGSSEVGTAVAALLSGSKTNFGPFVLPDTLSNNEKQLYDSLLPGNIIQLALISSSTAPKSYASTNINYTITIPAQFELNGLVTWQAVVFTTNGLSDAGVTTTCYGDGCSSVVVGVESNVVGQVVLTAAYNDVNGNVIQATPVTVLWRGSAPDSVITNIEFLPSSISAPIGSSLQPSIWCDYSDGVKTMMCPTVGDVAFSSSDPSVAEVNTNGIVNIKKYGAATIGATWGSFYAQAAVLYSEPMQPKLILDSVDGRLQIFSLSSAGTTNIVQSSSNLIDWTVEASLVPTNGIVSFEENWNPFQSSRFFRFRLIY